MKKYSKQNELILKSLKSRKDHPTAEMLYMDLKREMPNIGIATIYRNLLKLHEQGEIIKVDNPNGPDRFDGFISPHIHLICENCNQVHDILLSKKDIQEIDNVLENITKKIGANYNNIQFTIKGICKNCK